METWLRPDLDQPGGIEQAGHENPVPATRARENPNTGSYEECPLMR